MNMARAVGAAVALTIWGSAALAQGAAQKLEEIVVEERAPGDFDDVEAWNREVRDGLSRATLKQRDELTAHDHEQILILEQEMPVLKKALDDIERLVREHRFRGTLRQGETLRLTKAYQTAEAILENIPDAFMPRCRQLSQYSKRNKAATCAVDYFAIERQLDELKRKRGSAGEQEIARRGEAIPVVAPKDAPFIKVASSPKPAGAARVHVQSDAFRVGQVRVTFSGDTMVAREDFHAIATELPELRPAHAFRLELPTGTGMSMTAADKLKVIGHVSMGEELLRVVSLPRAAAIGYGIVVRNDDTIEGTLVAFEYVWSDRRRLSPVNGFRAIVIPADARLLRQYDVDELVAGQPFARHDVVFAGVADGKLALDVRRYEAPSPAGPVSDDRVEFPAQPGTIEVAGMQIELRELEPQRLKYVVSGAAPALALAAAPAQAATSAQ